MGSPTPGSDCNGGLAPRQSLTPLYGHIQKHIGGKVRVKYHGSQLTDTPSEQ